MGCRPSKILMRRTRNASPGYLQTSILASQTSFSMNEVEALFVLYKQMSSSIVDDGLINKEEFQLALLGSSKKKNIFLDRVFALFDVNQKGVIEFGDFVRSINIFHPNASQAYKIQFAFNLFDVQSTGYIERDQVPIKLLAFPFNPAYGRLKEMVLAILEELNLSISEDSVEAMLTKTFMEVDTKRDGKIDPEEWKEFVGRNPYLMKNMTLDYLKDLSITFPSFMMTSQVEDSDLKAAEGNIAHSHCHPKSSVCTTNSRGTRAASSR